ESPHQRSGGDPAADRRGGPAVLAVGHPLLAHRCHAFAFVIQPASSSIAGASHVSQGADVAPPSPPLVGGMISRLPLVDIAETRPDFSICSSKRAARL